MGQASGRRPVSGAPVTGGVLCPQGKEPSVRQLALLHFRDAITLSVKLEDALARAHARVPPAIVQMLLVLQVGARHGRWLWRRHSRELRWPGSSGAAGRPSRGSGGVQ